MIRRSTYATTLSKFSGSLLLNDGTFPSFLCSSFTFISFHCYSGKPYTRGTGRSETQLDKLSKDGSFDSLVDSVTSFNQMLRMGWRSRGKKNLLPPPSIKQFNHLLGLISSQNEYSTTLALIRILDYLDIDTFNIAINCFCQLRMVDYSFSVLGRVMKLGLHPNCATSTTLLKELCANGETVAQGVKYFEWILKKGIQIDVFNYAVLIDGLCKAGNTSLAIDILGKMEQAGSGCRSNIEVYRIVIRRLCKDGQAIKALLIFSDLTAKGIKPNVAIYNCLIHGFCNLSQWKEVTLLLNEMAGRGIYPNEHTLFVLVDKLCKQAKATEAETVVELMIRRDVKPDIVTYNALLDGYCLLGKIDEARRVFDAMVSQGLSLKQSSYNIMINGSCKTFRTDQAMKLFKEMLCKGLTPDVITYIILIDNLCHAGRAWDAHMLLAKFLPNS